MTGDARGRAVQLVALAHLADRVRERQAAVKTELAASLDVGDRKTATLDDGTPVGGVTFTRGRSTPVVTDTRALTAFVAAEYPGEVELQVRPAFLAAILKATKDAGQPMTPDGTLDVPGVALKPGEPYLTVSRSQDPAALAALTDAIRDSRILALEDGAQ